MDDVSKPMNFSVPNSPPSISKFASPSILLFIDQLIVAAGGWIFWLAISKLSSTSEIGEATIIYSLAILVGAMAQLGLEYPLLKGVSVSKAKILGTAIVIELVITSASIPIIFYTIDSMYQGSSLQEFSYIAIGLLVLSSVGFVARFALIGLSEVKGIFLVDVAGTIAKFIVGYILVTSGFGVLGILVSILIQYGLVNVATLIIATKRLGFQLGSLSYLREVILDGLINTPSKLSRTLIFSLSIVLLAYFGVSSSDIGVFYMALTISVIVGNLASNMAYMIIPTSSAFKTDLSSGSIRIGLSFTAPLVVALIVTPGPILSIIGNDYRSAEMALVILAISVLPSAVVLNVISKFNNSKSSKKLMIIGSTEIIIFLTSFSILVPVYGILGAAISTLLSFIASAIISIIASKLPMKYIVNSGIAIIGGAAAGYAIRSLVDTYPLLEAVVSVMSTFIIIIALRNLSIAEVRHIAKSVISK